MMIAPIACSLIPKCTTLPWGLAPDIALEAGKNEPPPKIVVLLLPAKSADPPQSSGRTPAMALIIFPDAPLVERSLPASNTGIDFSQSAGSALLCKRFSN